MSDDRSEAPAHADARTLADARTFRRLLVNTLMTGVTSSFLWFALTFWVYLETRSVVATGVIGGAFSISSAFFGPLFGTFVDRHRKHTAMVLATTATAACFADRQRRVPRRRQPTTCSGSQPVVLGAGRRDLARVGRRPDPRHRAVDLRHAARARGRRDRANGMVGTVTGLSFAITSVFSGLVIGTLGMGWAYYVALALTVAALVHLATIRIDEPKPERGRRGRRRTPIDDRAAPSRRSAPCPG